MYPRSGAHGSGKLSRSYVTDDDEESPYRISQETLNYTRIISMLRSGNQMQAEQTLNTMRLQRHDLDAILGVDAEEESDDHFEFDLGVDDLPSSDTEQFEAIPEDETSEEYVEEQAENSMSDVVEEHGKEGFEETVPKTADSETQPQKVVQTPHPRPRHRPVYRATMVQGESLSQQDSAPNTMMESAPAEKQSTASPTVTVAPKMSAGQNSVARAPLVSTAPSKKSKKKVQVPNQPPLKVFPFPYQRFLEVLNDGECDYWSSMDPVVDVWNKDVAHDPKFTLANVNCLESPDLYTLEMSRSATPRKVELCDELRIIEADTDYPLFTTTKDNVDPKNIKTMIYASAMNPMIISIITVGVFKRIIIRTKQRDIRKLQLASEKDNLERIYPKLKSLKLAVIKSPAINEDLSKLEKMLNVTRYKFGLIFVDKGQNDENQIYSNCSGSPAYEEFLDLLGRVKLQGYTGYRGGLDVKNNSTGEYSVAIPEFKSYGIMFHVSTLLPCQEFDQQRVERKRHIGNDVVVLIFKERADEKDTFDPRILTSHFNSVFFIVSPIVQCNVTTHYVLNIVNRPTIASYVPYFPEEKPIFKKDEFKEFLLTKSMFIKKMIFSIAYFVGV